MKNTNTIGMNVIGYGITCTAAVLLEGPTNSGPWKWS